MIVTTPEKWDVVTRKATGDVQLAQIVRLLIIDEVHLLHEDRGAVIESLVARTLRQVDVCMCCIMCIHTIHRTYMHALCTYVKYELIRPLVCLIGGIKSKYDQNSWSLSYSSELS